MTVNDEILVEVLVRGLARRKGAPTAVADRAVARAVSAYAAGATLSAAYRGGQQIVEGYVGHPSSPTGRSRTLRRAC